VIAHKLESQTMTDFPSYRINKCVNVYVTTIWAE
jgi:hypothetical protein